MKKSTKTILIALVIILAIVVAFETALLLKGNSKETNRQNNTGKNETNTNTEINNEIESELNVADKKENTNSIENDQKVNEKENNTDEKESNTNADMEENNSKKEEVKLSTAEALKIGKEKYKEAGDVYFGIFNTSKNIVTIDDKEYRKITNSEKIENLFSSNGLRQYLKNNECVIEKDGEYYRIDADRGASHDYLGNQFEVVEIKPDRIEFNSVEKYVEEEKLDENYERVEITKTKEKTYKFVIVKENNEWKVEEYTLPY